MSDTYYDVEVIDHHELRIRRGPGQRKMGWDEAFFSCEGEAGLREHMKECGHEPETIDDIVKQANDGPEGQWVEVMV